MNLFKRKTAVGFKNINERTLQAYIKGNRVILEGTCDNESHLKKLISDLKLDTKGFPDPFMED